MQSEEVTDRLARGLVQLPLLALLFGLRAFIENGGRPVACCARSGLAANRKHDATPAIMLGCGDSSSVFHRCICERRW